MAQKGGVGACSNVPKDSPTYTDLGKVPHQRTSTSASVSEQPDSEDVEMQAANADPTMLEEQGRILNAEELAQQKHLLEDDLPDYPDAIPEGEYDTLLASPAKEQGSDDPPAELS